VDSQPSNEANISDAKLADSQISEADNVSSDAKKVDTQSVEEPTKRGFTRRLLFKGAAGIGILVAACGGVAALAASSKSGGSSTTATGSSNINAGSPNVSAGSAVGFDTTNLQVAGSGKLREYWIQADSFYHNLMPTGLDAMSGTRYSATQSSYWAIGYRAYTADWKTPLAGNDTIGGNTGIPGPIIRAEVGDTVRVHFRNNDTHYHFNHSMHPHGLLYTPANDGTWIAQNANQPGTALKVGETFTYEWKAVASSVGSWPYHDHSTMATIPGSTSTSGMDMGSSNGIMELGAELGLFGMIVVTDSQTPEVDREIILCFHDLYETDVPQLSQDFDCFNGYAFLGNTPTFEARIGERVRWRIMALGKDFHVFHLHGHRWLFNGRYDDALVFGPSTTLTFDYVEDNPGTWLYHCHVTDHMMGGMVGYYVSK
jgi:FtsP/CotA-like multicopper oxidase with cupredoxin domain